MNNLFYNADATVSAQFLGEFDCDLPVLHQKVRLLEKAFTVEDVTLHLDLGKREYSLILLREIK